MFYNTKIDIFNIPNEVPLKTIYADVQPYSATVNFGYGLSLQITNRVFCDVTPEIDNTVYFKIGGSYYKVISIKTWSDYMEILLYKCKRQVG